MTNATTTTRSYGFVTAALLLLLVATVSVRELSIGPAELIVTLAIAVAKAVLVGVFFMHLRYASPMMRLFAIAGLCWMAILLTLTMTDVATRAG